MLIFLHLVVTQLLMKTRYFMFLGPWGYWSWVWFNGSSCYVKGGFLESFKSWSSFAGSQRTYWIFSSPHPIANNVTLPQQRNPDTIFHSQAPAHRGRGRGRFIVWADVFGTIATIDLLVKSVASRVILLKSATIALILILFLFWNKVARLKAPTNPLHNVQ